MNSSIMVTNTIITNAAIQAATSSPGEMTDAMAVVMLILLTLTFAGFAGLVFWTLKH